MTTATECRSATLLEVATCHVAYGKVEAVHDVSLTVERGHASSP